MNTLHIILFCLGNISAIISHYILQQHPDKQKPLITAFDYATEFFSIIGLTSLCSVVILFLGNVASLISEGIFNLCLFVAFIHSISIIIFLMVMLVLRIQNKPGFKSRFVNAIRKAWNITNTTLLLFVLMILIALVENGTADYAAVLLIPTCLLSVYGVIKLVNRKV